MSVVFGLTRLGSYDAFAREKVRIMSRGVSDSSRLRQKLLVWHDETNIYDMIALLIKAKRIQSRVRNRG